MTRSELSARVAARSSLSKTEAAAALDALTSQDKENQLTRSQYKGSDIDVDILEASDVKLTIDGMDIQIRHDREAQAFTTGWIPYQTFESPEKLAEKIVDQFFAIKGSRSDEN